MIIDNSPGPPSSKERRRGILLKGGIVIQLEEV
jgi:hypothetical protein